MSGSFEQARLSVPQRWTLYPFAAKQEHIPSSGGVTGDGRAAGPPSRAAEPPAGVRPLAAAHLTVSGRAAPPQTRHRSGSPLALASVPPPHFGSNI